MQEVEVKNYTFYIYRCDDDGLVHKIIVLFAHDNCT